MSFYLILGCLVAGILHVATPKSFYKKYLSQNNFRSVLYSTLFGIPLPLCSCGVIPTAVSIYKEGASKGATVSFLTSTPQTGVDSILATYGILGLPFAIIRPFIALVTSLISGVLVNLFAPDKTINKTDDDKCRVMQADDDCGDHCGCGNNLEPAKGNKIIAALKYAFVDMLQDIGKQLIIGLVVAGLITILIPDSLFLFFNNNPFLEMFVVLLVAIPMYVCATGSIPIAAALMIKGLSPGAALVFLMAGPATNIASLMVLNKVMGKKTTLIYLLVIIVSAFSFGFIINYLLPTDWFSIIHSNGLDCHETDATPLWKWISSFVFLMMLANALILKRINTKKEKKVLNSKTMVYNVSGMTCNHCKSLVENNLKEIDGITDVVVDLSKAKVYVTGMADKKVICETITNLGFSMKEENNC